MLFDKDLLAAWRRVNPEMQQLWQLPKQPRNTGSILIGR